MDKLKDIDIEGQKEAQLYRIRKAAEYLSLEELTLIAQTAYGAACMARIREEYSRSSKIKMISEEKLEQAKRFMSTLEYLSEEEIQRFVDAVYSMAWMNRLLEESRNKKKSS